MRGKNSARIFKALGNSMKAITRWLFGVFFYCKNVFSLLHQKERRRRAICWPAPRPDKLEIKKKKIVLKLSKILPTIVKFKAFKDL
jgi:preprotein translocase subunit SecG